MPEAVQYIVRGYPVEVFLDGEIVTGGLQDVIDDPEGDRTLVVLLQNGSELRVTTRGTSRVRVVMFDA